MLNKFELNKLVQESIYANFPVRRVRTLISINNWAAASPATMPTWSICMRTPTMHWIDWNDMCVMCTEYLWPLFGIHIWRRVFSGMNSFVYRITDGDVLVKPRAYRNQSLVCTMHCERSTTPCALVFSEATSTSSVFSALVFRSQ